MNEISLRQYPDDSIAIAALGILIGEKDISHLSVREKIGVIETSMLKYPQLDIPVKHMFADGLYMRQILIPKGTLLVSKIHKYEQVDIMPVGDISVVTDRGDIVRIKGPYTGISKPGMKRLGYAYEDTLWIDVHATRETNIDILEDMLYADSFEELERFEIEKYRNDYQQVLIESGFSHEIARAQSENMDDQTTLSLEDYKIKIADSKIEGKGIFATFYISGNETIAPARINGMRTQAGRFTNHSSAPNAIMTLRDNGNIDLVATQNIYKNEEITVDYRQSLMLSRVNILMEE